MKYKQFLLVCLLTLSGCSQASNKTNTVPTLELTSSRVQVARGSEIDYQSYIQNANDELLSKVEHTNIQSTKNGSFQVEYSLKDNQEIKKTLTIDIVDYDKNGVYSPLDVTPDVVKNPEDITVLVNKVNQIPEGYVPDDLEPVIDNANQKLRKEANEAYTSFYNAAKSQGIEIHSISGYRTNETQTTYWNNQVKAFGEEYASQYSAYPRRSEHQLGLAIDISYKTTGDRLSESVATSPIGQFIVSDAYKYGFILRYPKDKVAVTNYGYEPWHMRYVGIDLATKLHEKNITLEEYYN